MTVAQFAYAIASSIFIHSVDKPCPSCLTVGVIDARKKINCCPRAFNHRSLSFHFRGLCVGCRKVSIPFFPYAQRQRQVCKTVAHDKQDENSTVRSTQIDCMKIGTTRELFNLFCGRWESHIFRSNLKTATLPLIKSEWKQSE